MKNQETTRKPGKPFRTPERIKRDKAFAKFIGEVVKQEREASGRTAADFAKNVLGVSIQGYYQITRGGTSVSESRANELLEKIGIESAFFAGKKQFIYPN